MFWKYIILFCLLTPVFSFPQVNNSNNQADYLIITPSEFNGTLTPLVKLREKRGFTVKIIDLEDIYKEYSNLSYQFAVRQYISDAIQYWNNPKPKYVLLVGDADLLPAYHVKSMFAVEPSYNEDSVAIDDWFVTNMYDKDKNPDAAIGRLPVKNRVQLENVISKIIIFETAISRKSYNDDIFFISDKTDAYFFEAETQKLENKCSKAGYRTKRIDYSEVSNFSGTKADILKELDNGAVLNNYYGHGAPKQWSKYSIFSIDDFDSSFCSTKPSIYTTLACSQNFDNKNDSSIVEKLVLYPLGGAVATIAPSGIGLSNDGSDFISKFYDLILNNKDMTIGEAVQKIKNETISSFLSDDAICRRFTILGDPALKLPVENLADVASGNEPLTMQLLQNYPNPFNASTIINYNLSKTSTVSLKVFDALGRLIDTLVDNVVQGPGIYKVSFYASSLSSGVYFYELKQNNLSSTKKMLLMR